MCKPKLWAFELYAHIFVANLTWIVSNSHSNIDYETEEVCHQYGTLVSNVASDTNYTSTITGTSAISSLLERFTATERGGPKRFTILEQDEPTFCETSARGPKRDKNEFNTGRYDSTL